MQDPTRTIRIGTSGHQYDHWRGVFYPASMPQSGWFAHYIRHFDCVEINNTFYQLPDAGTFDRWRDAAPPGFRYVLKYSRFGSHMKKLKDPDAHAHPFIERAQRLGERLGPTLVQLPPGWRADPPRLDAFLDRAVPALRCAVEFRDADWLREEVFEVLSRHNAALCIHDRLKHHPRVLTADWAYLRFHGPGDGAYPHQRLVAWADWIGARHADGLDVYAFFNNDAGGYAVRDARRLHRYTRRRV